MTINRDHNHNTLLRNRPRNEITHIRQYTATQKLLNGGMNDRKKSVAPRPLGILCETTGRMTSLKYGIACENYIKILLGFFYFQYFVAASIVFFFTILAILSLAAAAEFLHAHRLPSAWHAN